jgi:hypothetical protein
VPQLAPGSLLYTARDQMNDLVYGNSDVPPPAPAPAEQPYGPPPDQGYAAQTQTAPASAPAPAASESAATNPPPPTSPPPQTAPAPYGPPADQGYAAQTQTPPTTAPAPAASESFATNAPPPATTPPGYGEETIWDPRTSPGNTNIMGQYTGPHVAPPPQAQPTNQHVGMQTASGRFADPLVQQQADQQRLQDELNTPVPGDGAGYVPRAHQAGQGGNDLGSLGPMWDPSVPAQGYTTQDIADSVTHRPTTRPGMLDAGMIWGPDVFESPPDVGGGGRPYTGPRDVPRSEIPGRPGTARAEPVGPIEAPAPIQGPPAAPEGRPRGTYDWTATTEAPRSREAVSPPPMTRPLTTDLIQGPLPSEVIQGPRPGERIQGPRPEDRISGPQPTEIIQGPRPSELGPPATRPKITTKQGAMLLAGAAAGLYGAGTMQQQRHDAATFDEGDFQALDAQAGHPGPRDTPGGDWFRGRGDVAPGCGHSWRRPR